MEVTEDVPKESTDNPLTLNNEKKSPTPPPQEQPKKSKREDRSKKDDKNVEQFMKSLNSVPTVDEKLSLVCKKYVQTADDNRKLQFYIKQSDKRYALLIKEKEQLQHEFNKTVLVKSKLENLCRELQKQNKAVKEESLLKIREEEERRKETQAKFQNTLTEITALLQQNTEKNAKLRDDNISMTEKFKSVVQQYQLREQQVDKMAKQMTLESQLADAKLQKASLEHQAEKERIMAEMEQLKVTLAQYRAKIMELQGTETALKGQLSVYTDKYDEFQTALVKSNQVFGGFKEQMEKMSKKIQKLEKESLSWKNRWETSQKALLEMCADRQMSEERATAAGRHLAQMQSLCRTLQAERTVLLNSLKEHNIERPPLPTPPPAPAPAPLPPAHQPASNAKVDAMAANCAQLRQSLAHLQTQLNTLTNKKEESPKPEKTKKSKSKKNKQKANQEIEKVEAKDGSDNQNVEEVKVDDAIVDKIDDKTLDNLIQAMNIADIDICDLEVEKSDEGVIVQEVNESEIKDKTVEVNDLDVPVDINDVVKLNNGACKIVELNDDIEPIELNNKAVEPELSNEKVEPVELNNKAVGPVELNNKAVEPVELNNKAIEPVELNNKAVEPVELNNKAVEPVELNKKAVEPVELNNKAVEPVELNNKAVETVELNKKAVEPVELNNKAVEPVELNNKAVEPVELNNKAVEPELSNENVEPVDLSNVKVKNLADLNIESDNTVLQVDSNVDLKADSKPT